MTKKATRASSTHISVVGHITSTELVKLLTDTEAASGFANRFLWPMVHRVQVLPFGGEVYKVNFTDVRIELKQCLEFARMVCINPDSPGLRMNKQARDLWEVLYRKHSQGQPGMMGAVTSRGDAQTCRLALIYALLDKSPDIKLEHLSAAAAAWEYCEASARFIFGDKIGNPAADVIFRRLRGAPDGMTRSQINDFFAGKKSGKEIEAALKTLRIQGLAHPRRQDTGGRPRELWFPGEALN